MTEPANFGDFAIGEDPAHFDVDYREVFPEPVKPQVVNDDYIIAMRQQQDLMAKQLEWLCFHVSNILQMASSNPMMRMMMNKAAKNG